jgi:acetyl-CoA carboxylase carboxyltransferase component
VSEDHASVEARVEGGGGPARLARQRRLGRMTVRERIDALLDEGSFQELGRYARHDVTHSPRLAANRHLGDGLVCGVGRVEGRRVAVYAHDVTVLRGSLGSAGADKLCRLLDRALEQGLPVVAIADSDGARILEGMKAVTGNGGFLARVAALRGRVPQLTLACGLCVGSAAYAAALTDVVGMVADRSFMFVTGPKFTQVATREQVEIEDLGGSAFHSKLTGQCHALLEDDEDGLRWLRRMLGFLQPVVESSDAPERLTPDLEDLVPTDQRWGYDVREVVKLLFDLGTPTEIAPHFAPNLVCGFARLGGRAVAYLANQPQHTSGVLDVAASLKGSRHLRVARTWGLPVVTLVDVPGYLPGRKQEASGLLPFGAEFIAAYCELRTPSVCLILRKSYGGASVMSFQADVRLALPGAVVAPTGVDPALELELGPEPNDPSEEQAAARALAREEWLARHGHVWAAAEAGYLDQVVTAGEARSALSRALESLI